MRRPLSLLVPLLLLQACAGNGPVGPTIAELETREIELPRVDFDISNDDVIRHYQELLTLTGGKSLGGKDLHRLADLELEQSLAHKTEDEAAAHAAELQLQQAVSRYLEYLDAFPGRPDNDLILYHLSRAYAMTGENDKARKVMDELARDYPNSRYIDEIQFRRGENLFVDGRYAEAEDAYGVVVHRYPNSVFYEKALYKYGWTRFKLNKYEEAIDSFLRLLDRKYEDGLLGEYRMPDLVGRAERELIEDVLRVTSLSFSYLPDKDPLATELDKLGKRPYEPLLYRRLGELYQSKDRILDAADIFLAYSKRRPEARWTPQLHELAIDAYRKGGFNSLLLPEKERFVNSYNVGSPWWLKQDDDAWNSVRPLLTRHIEDIATHYHALARASKKPEHFKQAADWYKLFIASFPQDPKAARFNFLLAEARFDAGQYEDAVREYEKTAYDYPPHGDSSEAGYAALLAYDRLLKGAPEQQQPQIRQRLVASSLRFSEKFPADRRMPAVLLKAAELEFGLKQYEPAREHAQQLVDRPGTDALIRHKAWTLIAHASFELQDYERAELAYGQALATLPPKAKNAKALREQLAASIYKQGEIARDGGLHEVAASHFLRIAQVAPRSPIRIVAEYDAGTEYIAAENWNAAINLLEGFRKRYPKEKKWQKGVSEKLTLAYTRSGQNSRAARELENLVKLTPPEERGELMLLSADLYQQSGQHDRAIELYKQYVKLNPKPLARSIELRQKIADFYLARKDRRRHHFWLKKIVEADAKGGPERSDRSRYLAAMASLELTRPATERFRAAKLTRPLKQSLKRKKQLMKTALDNYKIIAEYGVRDATTEATYQIAEIYRHFARALLESERPKGLNEDELEEYNYLLEDQAFPFEEKALAIHEQNVARIPEGVWDDSVRRSLESLGEMMPFRYRKPEQIDEVAE